MAELGLKPKAKRVGDRKSDKKLRWYSGSYNELYTVFQKKNLIDDAENIVEPEEYQHTENIELSLSLKSPEILPIEEEAKHRIPDSPPTNTDSVTSISEIDNDEMCEGAKLRISDSSSSESESEELIAKNKRESPAECSKTSTPISKKTPPKVPPKPEHLRKVTKNTSQKAEKSIEEVKPQVSDLYPGISDEAIIELLKYICAESNTNENLQDNGNAGIDEEAGTQVPLSHNKLQISDSSEIYEEAEPTINKESVDEEFSDDADDDWYNELEKSCKN